MDLTFTPQEGAALWTLLAENSTDIIVRTDPRGFILHASPAIAAVGMPASGELFGRHLLDLVDPAHKPEIGAKLSAVAAGKCDESWTELVAPAPDGGKRWFEIRMQPVASLRESTVPAGVLGVMRNIDDRKSFERRLFVATMTDPLTGLSNRSAFTQMLGHLIDGAVPGDAGWMAMFNIDHFKAINLQFGPSVGDEVLVVFADYVRTELSDRDIISRIGGESFGVLFPGASPAQAEATCARIIASIAGISRAGGAGAIPITASAGLARIGASTDDTIRRAEVALALAKAKGRNRLEVEKG